MVLCMLSRLLQPSLGHSESCGSSPHLPVTVDLPGQPGQRKLDPDIVAFIEALARYAARKDHEAQEATGER